MLTRLTLPALILCCLMGGVLIRPSFVRAADPPRSAAGPAEALTATAAYSITYSPDVETDLEPAQPTYIKGLYLTYHAAGHEDLRSHALDLIDTTELNALVIDIKGDLGLLAYRSDVITATAIGANSAPTIQDWPSFMADLKARDIYTIARIVVFKDNYLARAHPEWAAIDGSTGGLWLDREKLPWLEPFHEAVWDYNIALAVEAAQRGFDEVQFDYVRFPTDGSISRIAYSQDSEVPGARSRAITGFLARAHTALEPYPTRLAVDVFGYTTWHTGDFHIGQDLPAMAPYLDVLSPMLYPSTYNFGLINMPQYSFAIAYPYEVVYESMIRAISRVKAANPDIIVRPWIQDFPDYQFDGRTYTPDEVRAQMFGAYDSGGGGWMLWDPRVKYTPEALSTTGGSAPPNEAGEMLVLRYETFGDSDEGSQRSAAGFRHDLEQLWAAGYYPVNLRDLVTGQTKYERDLAWLAQNGWPTVRSDELLHRRLNYVPAGKRPVVLTFDGSHLSQYRLLPDGSLDPNSAVGVLRQFHQEHPADWPLRATFFVQPRAKDPASALFGQPELAEQKLQNLVAWGMEIGSYTVSGVDLANSHYQVIRRELGLSQSLIEALIPDYEVVSLALPFDHHPVSDTLLRSGAYGDRAYEYRAIVANSGDPVPSPLTAAFNPAHITRIQATPDAVSTWLEFYTANPGTYYVAAGRIPRIEPGE